MTVWPQRLERLKRRKREHRMKLLGHDIGEAGNASGQRAAGGQHISLRQHHEGMVLERVGHIGPERAFFRAELLCAPERDVGPLHRPVEGDFQRVIGRRDRLEQADAPQNGQRAADAHEGRIDRPDRVSIDDFHLRLGAVGPCQNDPLGVAPGKLGGREPGVARDDPLTGEHVQNLGLARPGQPHQRHADR